MSRVTGLLALGLLGCLPLACVPQPKPIVVDLRYLHGAPLPETAQVEAAATCPIGVVSVVDDRTNKESIGDAGLPVLGTGVLEWATEGVWSLEEYGHPLSDLSAGSADFDGIGMEVAVSRIYCRSQQRSLRGVVVLTVKYNDGGADIGQRVYRGESLESKNLIFGSSNTGFAPDSAQEVLNEAFRNALVQIHLDVIALFGAREG